MTPWYEDDDLWREFEAVLLDESMLAPAADEARNAAALLQLAPDARALDRRPYDQQAARLVAVEWHV